MDDSRVEDPSEDVLAALLSEVVDERSEYLIVERLSDPGGRPTSRPRA